MILVTDQCPPQMIAAMGMEPADNFPDALTRAFEISGSDSKIAVIPNGVSIFFQG